MRLTIKIQKKQSRKPGAIRVHGGDLPCEQCQGKISPEDKFCSQCRTVILRRYCPGCRKLVPDHTRICSYCGTSATEKSKERFLLDSKAAPTILVLSFLALLFLLVNQRPEQETPSRQVAKNDKVATTSPSNSSPQQAIPAEQGRKSASALQESSPIIADKDVQKGAQLNLKGHTLIKQGRYREAVPLLYQAVETFPEDTKNIDYVFAQYNLGHSLRKIGKSDQAIPYLERCVVYDRRNQMFQRELLAARRDIRKDNS